MSRRHANRIFLSSLALAGWSLQIARRASAALLERLVAKAGLVAIACLTVWFDIAEGRAENAIDRTRSLTAANETACARHVSSRVADIALAAGSLGMSSAVIDGKALADIPVWKTIALGTHGSVHDLREALTAARCGIGDLADEALEGLAFTVGKTTTTVDLVVLSAADLGFDTEGVSVAEVYARAARLGLALCPAEVAPQLRLQYPDQRAGEFLRIAMEPVVTDRGNRVGFIVGNGGAGLFLIGGDARRDRVVPPTVRFVFIRPEGPADLRS